MSYPKELPKFSFREMLQHARNTHVAMADRFAMKIYFNNTLPHAINGDEGLPRAVYLLCQGYQMPQTSLVLKQMRWDEGPNFSRPQSIDFSGEAIAVDFILDEDMVIKQFFESWIKFAFDPDSASMKFPDTYMQTIYLYNLDTMDNPRHIVELQDAFPRSVSAVSFNQSSHNTPATVTVTFTFHRAKTYQGIPYDLLHDSERYPEMRGVQELNQKNPPWEGIWDRSRSANYEYNEFKDAKWRDLWDPEDPRIVRENRTYLGKAISFFSSQNPTIYNIINKTPLISL